MKQHRLSFVTLNYDNQCQPPDRYSGILFPVVFNRIKEGYVLVPNPYHPKMISKISLSPAVVDCFVFWTKNPAPMLNQLEKLQDYNYYFQFTLNPYGEKLENHLPSINKRMDTFKSWLIKSAGKGDLEI